MATRTVSEGPNTLFSKTLNIQTLPRGSTQVKAYKGINALINRLFHRTEKINVTNGDESKIYYVNRNQFNALNLPQNCRFKFTDNDLR